MSWKRENLFQINDNHCFKFKRLDLPPAGPCRSMRYFVSFELLNLELGKLPLAATATGLNEAKPILIRHLFPAARCAKPR